METLILGCVMASSSKNTLAGSVVIVRILGFECPSLSMEPSAREQRVVNLTVRF